MGSKLSKAENNENFTKCDAEYFPIKEELKSHIKLDITRKEQQNIDKENNTKNDCSIENLLPNSNYIHMNEFYLNYYNNPQFNHLNSQDIAHFITVIDKLINNIHFQQSLIENNDDILKNELLPGILFVNSSIKNDDNKTFFAKSGDLVKIVEKYDKNTIKSSPTLMNILGQTIQMEIKSSMNLNSFDRLALFTWYHHKITKHQSEILLSSCINGSFLVRRSQSKDHSFTLSYRLDELIHHFGIRKFIIENKSFYYIFKNIAFQNIQRLVEYYSINYNYEFKSNIKPNKFPPKDNIPNEETNDIEDKSDLNDNDDFCKLNDLELKYSVPNRFFYEFLRISSTPKDKWEINRYQFSIKYIIGCGQYGEVYMGIWKKYELNVAIKSTKISGRKMTSIITEANIMKKLSHPNIIKLYGVCSVINPIFLVIEYMNEDNLAKYLKNKMTNNECFGSSDKFKKLLEFIVQICSAMEYLEEKLIVHRDLAARNCLIDSFERIKISDFGMAVYVGKSQKIRITKDRIPLKWCAPESISQHIFSSKTDVWAFGIVVWEITSCGLHPYPGISVSSIFNLLQQGYRLPKPIDCSNECYEIMMQCWKFNNKNRPSFKDLMRHLMSIPQTNLSENPSHQFKVSEDSLRNPQRISIADFESKNDRPITPISLEINSFVNFNDQTEKIYRDSSMEPRNFSFDLLDKFTHLTTTKENTLKSIKKKVCKLNVENTSLKIEEFKNNIESIINKMNKINVHHNKIVITEGFISYELYKLMEEADLIFKYLYEVIETNYINIMVHTKIESLINQLKKQVTWIDKSRNTASKNQHQFNYLIELTNKIEEMKKTSRCLLTLLKYI